MALTFGAGSTDNVSLGNGGAIDDMQQATVLAWVKLSTLTTLRCVMGKKGNWALNLATAGAVNLRWLRTRASANMNYTTNDARLVTGSWLFIAATMDASLGSAQGHIYIGTLAALATESTYGISNDGAGTLDTDAGEDFVWCNSRPSAAPQPLQGDMAACALYGRVLTLAEVRRWQRRPGSIAGAMSCLLLGYDGTGTQRDRSGGGYPGTVTGATLASGHVPLQRYRRGAVSRNWRSAATVYPVSVGGSVTPAGAVVRSTTKVLAGAATPAGAVVRSTAKVLAGGATPAGTVSALKVAIRTFTGALTPSGAISRLVGKLLAGGATPAGTLVRSTTKVLAGGATPAGALSALKVSIRAFTGALTPSGAISRLVGKLLAGDATPAGTLVRSTKRALAGAATPAGAVVRSTTRRLTGALTPTGAVGTLKVAIVALAGVLAPAGAVVRSVGKVLAGALAAVGALVPTRIPAGGVIVMKLVAGLGSVLRAGMSAAADTPARFSGRADPGSEG